MAVRTEQLAHGELAGPGFLTLYTVPEGKTAILKSWCLLATITTLVQLRVKSTVPVSVLIFLQQLAENTPHYSERWIVLAPGDVLEAYVYEASTLRFILSGTELLGVSS